MGSRNVRGRMLHWKISNDQRVNSLSSPWAMLLYTWLIPCQDNRGRMEGDADVIKGMVFPRIRSATTPKVSEWLKELHNKGLIFKYRVGGQVYLQFPPESVSKHQKIVGNMTDESDFPDPPKAEFQEWVEKVRVSMNVYEPVSPEGKGREGKVSEEEGKVREGNTSTKPATIVDRINALHAAFDDKEWLESQKKAFPHVNFERERVKMEAWIRSRPDKSNKKNWKRFINTWLGRTEKEREQSGGSGQDDSGDRATALSKAVKRMDV